MKHTAESRKEKVAALKKAGFNKVKIAITDLDGVMRGKYISLEKFESILNGTGGFCDCVFGWDMNDALYDNAKFTGWHTAYPDALYKIDLATERILPDENVPFYLADFVSSSDQTTPHPICPRQTLKKVLAKAESMGFGFNLAFEYEFFLFNETPQSVRDKNYQNLKTLTPGMFGYSVIRNSTQSELFQGMMDYFAAMKVEIEGFHCETGPGVWEAAIKYDKALISADNANIFKTFTKVYLQKRDIMATFMARWNASLPGMGGHMHQSIYDLKTGKSLFYDANADHNISPLMQSYLAGQIKYTKSFLAMISPTINSYTRLVKGFWAPTAVAWGIENRTTALRVIPGSEKSQRVEFRVAAADANPYLAAAAVLGAGLLGIEENLKLGPPIKGNAYAVQEKIAEEYQLPSNLSASADNLDKSAKARELFGAEFVEHYVISRRWEVREHEKAITDWQLQRYFEII
ncbi:MAG: glutamine synthetase [Bdellovibrionota bacterium]